MQFLTMLKAREDAGQPPAELFEAMGRYIEKVAAAGHLVLTGGLMPTSAGFTVHADGGRPVVTDGPFAEATEVVGGYAILQADTREEVEELAREFVQLHIDAWPGWQGTSEVRQIAEF